VAEQAVTISESFLPVLRHFGWWDVLDVLIVAVAIYEILKLVRGTRAVQMGLGAGLLVLIYYVSRWAHLGTVNWLIRNMVGYLVFGLIVLFQADIRRALAHFGRTPFGSYFARTQRADEVIEEIVVAAGLLAGQRIGGIVAIERSIGLRNYIEGGIPLDATVTNDLLVTIFRPGTPLHDGAVIIQGDRVAAAACFLPLTVNPRVSKDFGTRHRAAIGLTEETDAVTVIVSEETGRISLALEGGVDSGLTTDDLRRRLRELLTARIRDSRELSRPVYD
jgi:diadenylate cyclase